MAPGLLMLIVIAAIVVMVSADERSRATRARALAAIAGELRGESDGAQATGSCGDIAVAYRFTLRRSGRRRQSWTEIDATIPAAYPLALHVRPHCWGDRDAIARGEMVDVQLGDAAFDDAFLIEAAPADVARLLLDPPIRAVLAEHRQIALTTDRGLHRATLRLAFRGCECDVARAIQYAGEVARLAGRVREAFEAADHVLPERVTGDPYRPVIDDQPARDAAAAREAEVARVEQLRGVRLASPSTALAIAFVIFGLVALAMAAAAH